MKVKIRTPQGKIKILEVEETDKIEDLKAKIAAELKIPFKEQRLMFAGEVLKNTDIIEDIGITCDTIIFLMVMYKGGFTTILDNSLLS